MKKIRSISFICLFVVTAAVHLHAQWQQVTILNNVLSVGTIISNDSCILAGTWDKGVFRSLDSATTWTSASTGLTGKVVVRTFCRSSNFPKTVIIGADSLGLLYSANLAGNWIHYADSSVTNKHIYSVIIGGVNTLAATLGGGVFVSADNGLTWSASNSGLTNLNVRALVSAGLNMYAGTDSGNVFRSIDKGATWTPAPLGSTSANVYTVALLGRYAFAGTYGSGLFRSADSGKSWVAINSGLTQTSVRTLLVSGKNLFAGADSAGVFLSSDSGDTWTAIGSGLPVKNVTALYVYGSNLLAGTAGNGLWKRALSEFISVEAPTASQSQRFSLDRNSPNPFSLATTVSYRVSKECMVRIGVYSLDGKLITTLVNNQRSPGNYKAAWNSTDEQGRRMNPGVYVVKMNAGKFSASRKMMFLR